MPQLYSEITREQRDTKGRAWRIEREQKYLKREIVKYRRTRRDEDERRNRRHK